MDNSFRFLNYKYTIYQFSGRVVARDRETTVSTRGRTIYTVTYKDFFLVNDNGKERHFSFNDIDLPPLRIGHILQVMWVIKKGKKTGEYVLVRNVSLNQDSFIIENMDRTKKGMPVIIMITLTLLSLIMTIYGILNFIYIELTRGFAPISSWSTPLLFFIGGFFITVQIYKSFRRTLIRKLTKLRLVI